MTRLAWTRTPRTHDANLSDALLQLCSLFLRVEPGLLRGLRDLLVDRGATVDDELAVWNHPSFIAQDGAGGAVRYDLRGELVESCLGELDGETIRAAVAEARRWHDGPHAPSLWAAEVVALHEAGFDGFDAETVSGAKETIRRLHSLVLRRPRMDGMDTWARAVSTLQRVWTTWQDDELGALCTRAWNAVRHLDEPGYIPDAADLTQLDHLAEDPQNERRLRLVQRGSQLELVELREASTQPERLRGSPIADLTITARDLSLSHRRSHRGAEPCVAADGAAIPLDSATGHLWLRTDRVELTIERTPGRPWWASAAGRDAFGMWAEFAIEGVTHRMRYIPPGRFAMGSPEDEEGRRADEVQHDVVITRGCWLGESPVTQDLWDAVGGVSNPSRFKGANRPVESLDWPTARHFGERVENALERARADEGNVRDDGWPATEFRLPTEAEWELACRAGTSAARYGALDDIAWWVGNSGGSTHAVKTRAPNPWGLYDMLGNVHEWCDDWFGDHGRELATDPTGPEHGKNRVIRGGTFVYSARGVRAARRRAFHPSLANHSLGFRLARGHAPQAPEAEQRPPEAGAGGPEGGVGRRDADLAAPEAGVRGGDDSDRDGGRS